MIKVKVNNEYKDVVKIFGGGILQKEIIKVWSGEARGYVYESSVEYSGPLQITISANGDALIDYRIYGNTVQTGTPTPENPIIPSGCGELETTGVHTGQYKLPILSNSTVTNIYLGEVETTRRIKKFVLTGAEPWMFREGRPSNVFFIEILGTNAVDNCALCTHYLNQNSGFFADLEDKHLIIKISSSNTKWFVGIRDSSFSFVYELKNYLAAQYAAGTPVTVWYALAESEATVVNEPLMKIGDYADTVSMEQAGVSIPTNKGTTIIDYDGTPKPSQMYIKYRR